MTIPRRTLLAAAPALCASVALASEVAPAVPRDVVDRAVAELQRCVDQPHGQFRLGPVDYAAGVVSLLTVKRVPFIAPSMTIELAGPQEMGVQDVLGFMTHGRVWKDKSGFWEPPLRTDLRWRDRQYVWRYAAPIIAELQGGAAEREFWI